MPALTFHGPRPFSRRSRRRQTPRFQPQGRLESLEDRRLLSGTWTDLANPVPAHTPDGTETMLLLSDGTVMVQGGGGGTTAANKASSNWFKLTPDASGNYANGTWSPLASMGTQRQFYASNVLKDGRVFVLGGEYSGPPGADPSRQVQAAVPPIVMAAPTLFHPGRRGARPGGEFLLGEHCFPSREEGKPIRIRAPRGCGPCR
jgi:hypothetical protein